VDGDPAFELSGRLAIRQGEQALSAGLRWRYDGASEEMVISGPLGAGSAELTRDAGGVTFRGGGRVQQSADAESLMRSMLGFALPLDGLRYWVRGQPGPGERAVRIERDAMGRLESFFEAGWQVSIPAYSVGSLAALPRRIDVQSSELAVRLVIDQWLEAPAAISRVRDPGSAGQ
jgi:outer membrane lipoprotein LolB